MGSGSGRRELRLSARNNSSFPQLSMAAITSVPSASRVQRKWLGADVTNTVERISRRGGPKGSKNEYPSLLKVLPVDGLKPMTANMTRPLLQLLP